MKDISRDAVIGQTITPYMILENRWGCAVTDTHDPPHVIEIDLSQTHWTMRVSQDLNLPMETCPD